MTDLINTIDWSRAQFALTAMYHWLFVPLTLGLGIIVAIMESIYVRKKLCPATPPEETQHWLDVTKYWMRIFGINFAIGVATGIILEFEFGTNWANYSWFVGDIFGAPLAIEGIFAFFCESTFFAVMFFGWEKFSPRQHLAATWLTAFGATLSAWWILVANAWMQHPVGMAFDPETMRCTMESFLDVALSSTAINKFTHTVTSTWSLAGVFVVGVSSWYLLKGRHTRLAHSSIRIGSIVGLAGILLAMWSGDGSAVEISRTQPMKLAAMEGLYEGRHGVPLTAFGILNPDKKWNNDEPAMEVDIAIPCGLSILSRRDANAFVPGIKDIIEGRDFVDGKEVYTVSYAERMERGALAQEALRTYHKAKAEGNDSLVAKSQAELAAHYPYFGYGYLKSVDDAVPPVGLTFYPFHIMVVIGGWLLVFLAGTLITSVRRPGLLEAKVKGLHLFPLLAIATIPLDYVCSQCGWMVAEIGRQPWTIQDLLPCSAAISHVSTSQVQTTFFLFLLLFTALLIAEISIIVKHIKNY